MPSSKEDEHNRESTGYDCAVCERPNHADSNMVCCEKCQNWYHFMCANVTAGVENRSWMCKDCLNQGTGDTSQHSGTVVDVSDVSGKEPSNAADPKAAKTLPDNEQDPDSDQEKAEVQHQEELRRMRANFERQLQREKEKMALKIRLEREMLLRKKEVEAEFIKMRSELHKEFECVTDQMDQEEGAIGGKCVSNQAQAETDLEEVWRDKFKFPDDRSKPADDFRGAFPQSSTYTQRRSAATVCYKQPPTSARTAGSKSSPRRTGVDQSSDSGKEGSICEAPHFHWPARGVALEWPLFISSFNNGNAACNWTDLENLGRLQESIRGPALEAVRSRLLLPESVPRVIDTLRLLYGRPEQLLHSLMQKARKADSPRADRLGTFIHYGMVVQQLCDHLTASGLVDHLVNPMLITELVEKLPPNTKMEWVRYKRLQHAVDLSTFSDFLSIIVSEATEATLYTDLHVDGRPNRDRKEKKSRDHEGYLNAHIGVEHPPHRSPNQHKVEGQQTIRKPCRGCNSLEHRTRSCEDFQRLAFNDRLKITEKWKMCQLCLNEHGQTRCRFKGHCNVGGCKERHHPLLHPPNPPVTLSTNCHVHGSEQHPIIFRMVPIKLHHEGRSLDVVAFLDEGSSYSLMESTVADQLKLKGTWEPILVKWTAGMSRLERDSRCVNISISAAGSKEKYLLRNVHTVKELQLPEQRIRFAEVAARFKHLCGLPVADCSSGSPKVLIGLKHLHVYAPLESRIGNPGEPIAVRTKLGWTIYSPQGNDDMATGFAGHHSAGDVTELDLQELLRKHFTLEESGLDVKVLPESAEDCRAKELLEQTTIRVRKHFETGLLWRSDNPQLPDSFPMALKRMKSLERRLGKDLELKRNVDRQIEDYQKKGYAHIATNTELMKAEPGKVWYLPLNVVLNPKKPGKVRLVWDAAASVQGKSLNSELLKGPDLLSSLPSVLCPFRERPVAFGGDIAEMYHQLRIRSSDKSAQRFLYRTNASGPPVTYVMDVATFGSTSSPCSAQFIKNRNAQEHADKFSEAVDAIVNKHYVDDYFDSTFTVSEAIKRAEEVAFIHSNAGFHIRNWVSNSEEFQQHFGRNPENHVVHFASDKSGGNSTERVLGMSWNTAKDVFVCSTVLRDDLQAYLTERKLPTKRALLSVVMSFFDPLGLWAPFTVLGKIIVQDLCRNGCSWDEIIDEVSAKKWFRWIALLPSLQTMEIPRCYFADAKSSDYQDLELHVFADASEDAYGCVAYFRLLVKGQPRVALVSAKSKVAPLQYMSIPRMELLAAVLGARLAASVKSNHSVQIKRVFYHIDSATVLSWIRSDHRRYKQFVAYRIGDILSLTNPNEWGWVATKNNIADVLTKWGKNGPPLETGSEWVRGPDILYQSQQDCYQRGLPPPGVKEELRAYHLFHEVSFSKTLIDTTRFSRWTVLVRSVACIFRFISNCRKKVKKQPIETIQATPSLVKMLKSQVSSLKSPLKRDEHQAAENYLWRIAQQEGFPDERKTLLKNSELPQSKWHRIERSSPLYRLAPFLDAEGVIRMEGRAAYAEFISFEQRFPIVLPKGHDITSKLLLHYHKKFGHANRETVVNELRLRFYVQNIRAAILQDGSVTGAASHSSVTAV
ncbi:uncharacterized protein LOC134290142 [Aedes albopictus]|uniref:PHD-type domain-containing protein n=1 Tax=Aedes albopictus TaxID=7160 RepID=A0ABM1ZL58_AEDAL